MPTLAEVKSPRKQDHVECGPESVIRNCKIHTDRTGIVITAKDGGAVVKGCKFVIEE